MSDTVSYDLGVVKYFAIATITGVSLTTAHLDLGRYLTAPSLPMTAN
jgi:hypothetical protein